MSGLMPKLFISVLCKLKPRFGICRARLLEEYADCYQLRNYSISSLVRLPQRLWHYLIGEPMVDTSRPECVRMTELLTEEPLNLFLLFFALTFAYLMIYIVYLIIMRR